MILTNFLLAVDTINVNNYNYGNDILYSSFNFTKGILPIPGTTLDSKLSSAMSIIGKSYSADPTRSAPYGVLQNNGTGNSFDFIANRIVTHPDYNELYSKISKLSSSKLDYSCSKNDISILEKSVFCVASLNHIIRDIMNTKANNNQESKNTVSFCSKFLHFLCPNVFFIKDSISLSSGNKLYKGNKSCSLKLNTPEFIAKKETSAISEYLTHVTHSYYIAKILSDNGKICTPQILNDPNSTYMPRLVDSILMNAEKFNYFV